MLPPFYFKTMKTESKIIRLKWELLSTPPMRVLKRRRLLRKIARLENKLYSNETE